MYRVVDAKARLCVYDVVAIMVSLQRLTRLLAIGSCPKTRAIYEDWDC